MVSRQREYQKRNALKRKCMICGKPRARNVYRTKNVFSQFCEKHRIAHKTRNLARYYSAKGK